MIMRNSALLVLALWGSTASALDISDPRRYTCRQGDCANGEGMVHDAYLQVTMKGRFAGGATIPGIRYTVISPLSPERKFNQVYGKDGLLLEGEQPRTLVFNGAIPFFKGTYVRVNHPFVRLPLPVLRKGVYDTGTGFEYRGRFEFLPAKSGIHTHVASGYYIFFGDKVDTEDNETETGLYVSDETMTGAPVRFSKAQPAYLAQMQMKYQRDLEIAKDDFREIESERKWRSAIGMVMRIGFAAAGGSSGNNVGADIAMEVVSSMFNNSNQDVEVKDIAKRAVDAAVQADPKLNAALVKAVSDGIADAN